MMSADLLRICQVTEEGQKQEQSVKYFRELYSIKPSKMSTMLDTFLRHMLTFDPLMSLLSIQKLGTRVIEIIFCKEKTIQEKCGCCAKLEPYHQPRLI